MTRASDHDRDRIVDQLRAQSVAGRISHANLERRLERALTAETVEQLQAVLVDLPALSRTATPTAHSTAQLQLVRTGIRPFILQLVVARSAEQVRAAAWIRRQSA